MTREMFLAYTGVFVNNIEDEEEDDKAGEQE